jgi:hypothetical protein
LAAEEEVDGHDPAGPQTTQTEIGVTTTRLPTTRLTTSGLRTIRLTTTGLLTTDSALEKWKLDDSF